MTSKIIQSHEGVHLNVMGDHQTIKLSGKETNGAFTLIEQNNPPGTGIPPHVHENEDELFQVLEGEVEFVLGDKKSILKKGDMIFLPRTVPHSFTVIGSQNAKVNLNIFPAGLEGMFEELSALPAGPPDLKMLGEICGKYGVRFV